MTQSKPSRFNTFTCQGCHVTRVNHREELCFACAAEELKEDRRQRYVKAEQAGIEPVFGFVDVDVTDQEHGVLGPETQTEPPAPIRIDADDFIACGPSPEPAEYQYTTKIFDIGVQMPKEPLNRKHYPMATGLIDYFPDALMEVAHVSFVGNEQHNPGQPVHWDRSKSSDEADAMMRHFKDRGTIDTDGIRHSAKCVWRALALLQKEIERNKKGAE